MYKIKQNLFLFFVSLCLFTPITDQTNDLCNGSKQLTVGTLLCNQNNIKAHPDEPNSCGYHKASVWYKFTTAAAGNYVVEISDANFNDVLTLFSGTCGNLTERTCTNENEYGFNAESLNEPLSGNTEYYIMVSGTHNTFGRTLGEFCIKVRKANANDNPPSAGGDCTQATLVNFDNAGKPSTCIVGTNKNASKADPKPTCSLYAGASTWYKLEAGTSGALKLEYAPNFSQIVTVYSGACGNMEEIECSMNGESRSGEKMIINLSDPSAQYYIQVSGNFDNIEADYSSNANLCNNSDYYLDMSLSSSCLTQYIGTPCDDNNSSTSNDKINANCECKGTCAFIGNKCDDGDPNTTNDLFDMDCNCVGQCGSQGTVCDDGNPNTTNDAFDSNCNCVGNCISPAPTCQLGYVWKTSTCSCEALCVLNAPCDDNNIHTGDGIWDQYCNCVATCSISCVHEDSSVIYLPNEFCKCECFDFGKACDDGDPLTENDSYDISCNCNGTPYNECESDITITELNITEPYFEASNSIKTRIMANNVELKVTLDLTLNAGSEITLNPGFIVQSGATFHGYIEGCEQ